jgi:hypothetical protein
MENDKVRFTLSEADYVEYSQHEFKHVPIVRKRAIALMILITGLAELVLLGGTQVILTHPFFTHGKLYCANAITLTQLGVAAIGLIVFSATSYFCYFYRIPRVIFKTLKNQNHPITQERKLSLEAEGIKISGGGRDTLYRWDSLPEKALKESANLLIVYVDNITGLIIPKRAFNSQEDQQNFWKQVHEYAKPAE